MKKGVIIGFGRQGRQLYRAMRLAGVEVVAVCDINPDILQKVKSKESFEFSFPDLAELGGFSTPLYRDWRKCLTENQKMDIVAVATWTKEHAKVAVAAASSGAKAILCEEPMATTLYDARRIISACEQLKVTLAVHHTRRWWTAHQKVKKAISDGLIGDLRHIWISCGGARLGDLGTHWIDFALWLTGDEVESVTAWLGKPSGPNPRGAKFKDVPGDIVINFKNGVRAFINEANAALPPRYEIVGTVGRIANDQVGDSECWDFRVRLDPPEKLNPVTGYYGKLQRLLPNYEMGIDWKTQGVTAIKQLLRGETTECNGYAGYNTLEVLVAAHMSNGQPVPLPFHQADYKDRGLKIA